MTRRQVVHRAVVEPAWMDAFEDGGEERELALPQDVAHRFARVLRLDEGAPIELFDGAGRVVCARFLPPSRATAATLRTAPDELPALVVAQAMTSADKLEQVVQRATELGASEVLLFVAERSQGRLDAERAEKRRARLVRIAADAARQSGRARTPHIDGPVPFSALEERVRGFAGVTGVGALDADRAWSSLLEDESARAAAGALIVIGPEGGLSDRETEALGRAGAHGVRLGVFVLRTETAALAALAAAQAHFGRL